MRVRQGIFALAAGAAVSAALVAGCGSFSSPGPAVEGADASEEISKPDTTAAAPGVDASREVDASGADAGLDGDGARGKLYRVFVSSGVYTGSFGINGLVDADAQCNALGKGVDPSSRWIAYLATPTLKPVDRLVEPSGGWYLMDGVTLVAPRKTDLAAGLLAHAIDVDEKSSPGAGDPRVWTGHDGKGDITKTCSGWTSGAANMKGFIGNRDKKNDQWHADGEEGCDKLRHVYCFEQ